MINGWFRMKIRKKIDIYLCVICRFNLPFYLWACQHDNRIRPPCANVRQHSMHRLMYLMVLRKMARNNDVHDDVLIDIVVYEQPLCDATSNRQTLKHLRIRRKKRRTEKKRWTSNKSNKFLLQISRRAVLVYFFLFRWWVDNSDLRITEQWF